MKKLNYKIYPFIVHLMLCFVVFSFFMYPTFLPSPHGDMYICEDLSHSHECSRDEFQNSQFAWAIIVLMMFQPVILMSTLLCLIIGNLVFHKYKVLHEKHWGIQLVLYIIFYGMSVGIILFLSQYIHI